jgi:DNA helicase HerA-like ATPase
MQARAFGVGQVLVTQNPVDLDYKALSNAGAWFIGKLQTEQDRARLLDGYRLMYRLVWIAMYTTA